MEEDYVELRGIFFGLKQYPQMKIKWKENEFYHKLLPHDKIQYSKIEYDSFYEIEIHQIIERKSFYTLAIVSGFHSPTYFLFYPLLPKSFQFHLSNFPNLHLQKKERILIKIHLHHIEFIKSYGDVLLRDVDDIILQDLYCHSFEFPQPLFENIQISPSPHGFYTQLYTQPFQDLTHLSTFHIDPSTTKDIDDAISVLPDENKVFIHIVDITQIDALSPLDKQACFLGSTLYLPNQNFPMYPPYYAEFELSLLPNHNRRVITIEMELEDKKDEEFHCPEIKSYEIYPSMIQVKRSYHYENVENDKNEKDIQYLWNITEKYYKRSLSILHPSFICNEHGNVSHIEFHNHSSIPHFIIEMFMIMTNRLITNHLLSFQIKCPERYHPTCYYDDSLEQITDDDDINQICLIQKYKNATYDSTLHSHFGLQIEHYTHFTSPIRRYFDNIIHRILAGYQYHNIDEILKHINEREIINEQLIRLYNQWKWMDYIYTLKSNQHIFLAYVTNVNPKGIKIYCKELGYDTFILYPYIMSNIYWKWNDEKKYVEGGNKIIKIGTKINMICNQISFLKHDSIQWKVIEILN